MIAGDDKVRRVVRFVYLSLLIGLEYFFIYETLFGEKRKRGIFLFMTKPFLLFEGKREQLYRSSKFLFAG